jgi:hypothetical protein
MNMAEKKEGATKTLGQAIDELIQALKSLDQSSRITAIRATCEHLNIPLVEEKIKDEQASGVGGKTDAIKTITTLMDVKSLKEQKRPSSANEMAALVAFYLSEMVPVRERKTEVEVDDMVKYFKQAGFPLPKAPQVLLQNARNAGYFDLVGGGKYKLNPVGYNLVAHNLPRSQSETSTKTKRPRKRMRKKTSSKATSGKNKASQK